jgi:nitronate monooxygenase
MAMTNRPPLHTPLCDLLGCTYPVLLAGMGGVARAELVAAVGTAGGYGFLGMVRERPELIRREITEVRVRTDRPFGVNLIPAATDPALFAEELAVCLEADVHSMCFFWDVDADAIRRAKAGGCLVAYQVGSAEDARAAEAAGADLVIAQGVEAGGHVRGTVTSLVLVPQVAAAVQVPIAACGGFATGAQLVAALALGAHGIVCGTAFLATEESFAHDHHKRQIVAARAEDTLHTDAFAINWPPGSPVRVIGNSLTRTLGPQLFGHHPDAIERTAIADEDGRPIYRWSTDSPLRYTTGDLEALAQFAGQSAALVDDVPSAAARFGRIVAEARTILERLGASGVVP